MWANYTFQSEIRQAPKVLNKLVSIFFNLELSPSI